MYRANIMFKNFKVEGPADKLIVYLTCFIQKCLQEIARKPEAKDADKAVASLVAESVQTSGDNTFFMRKLGLIN